MSMTEAVIISQQLSHFPPSSFAQLLMNSIKLKETQILIKPTSPVFHSTFNFNYFNKMPMKITKKAPAYSFPLFESGFLFDFTI